MIDLAALRALAERQRSFHPFAEVTIEAGDLLALVEATEALGRMLDPSWWREEVDANGEYTTSRPRGYYECVGEIRAALSPFRPQLDDIERYGPFEETP